MLCRNIKETGLLKAKRPMLDQIQELIDQQSSGFVAWDYDSAEKHNGDANGFLPSNTFTLLQGGYGRILGKFVRFEAQSITVPTTYGIVYIWVDISGTIHQTTTIDYSTGFPLFQVFIGASVPTKYYVARENHFYGFDTLVSQYIHRAAGTVISGSGGNIVASSTLGQIAISGNALYEDHGLISRILDSDGAGVSWIQDFKNASGQWESATFSATISPKYNNSGVATALGTNEYGAYRLYVVKDDGQGYSSVARYIAVMHTAKFASSGQAQTACDSDSIAKADNELLTAEVCQLGFITIKGDGTIIYVKPAKNVLAVASQGIAGLATIAFTGLASDLVSAVFAKKISAIVSSATEAGFNIGAYGAAPSSPVDGDVFKSAADVLAVRMSTNTRTFPFIEKANAFTAVQTARGFGATRQTNTPTGTTYAWNLSSGNGLGITLTSSTGNVTITTSNPTATVESFLDALGHASNSRDLIITQSGVTFVMTGKTSGSTIKLDTLTVNQRAHYMFYWATTTLCFITRMALV